MCRSFDAHHAYVATEGAAVVGIGIIKGSGEIVLNHVSPDARFRGISKAIIARLEARARELGVDTVTLQSAATALRFYRSAGYKALGPPTRGYGVTFCYPMAKLADGR